MKNNGQKSGIPKEMFKSYAVFYFGGDKRDRTADLLNAIDQTHILTIFSASLFITAEPLDFTGGISGFGCLWLLTFVLTGKARFGRKSKIR